MSDKGAIHICICKFIYLVLQIGNIDIEGGCEFIFVYVNSYSFTNW